MPKYNFYKELPPDLTKNTETYGCFLDSIISNDDFKHIEVLFKLHREDEFNIFDLCIINPFKNLLTIERKKEILNDIFLNNDDINIKTIPVFKYPPTSNKDILSRTINHKIIVCTIYEDVEKILTLKSFYENKINLEYDKYNFRQIANSECLSRFSTNLYVKIPRNRRKNPNWLIHTNMYNWIKSRKNYIKEI